MKRSKNLNFLVLLIALVLTLSVVQNSQAYKISWRAGDSYIWGAKERSVIQFYNQTQDIDKKDSIDELIYDIKLNITEVNIISMNIEFFLNIGMNDFGLTSASFDWKDFINEELTTQQFFDCDYTWDTYENRTILLNAQLSITPYILIYPDWAGINKDFKNTFNSTYVVSSVYNPVLDITENYTVGSFLGNSSYSIMGKNNLPNALNKFTANTKHWSMTYDLSNYLMADKLDFGFSPGYHPYEYYLIVLELEYEEGGKLQKYSEKVERRFVMGNSTFYFLNELLIVFGGIESLTANFYLISFLTGIVVVSILIKFVRKKKA